MERFLEDRKGNFTSSPGLTQNLIRKMPPSIFTAKGRLTQEKSNLQSTKVSEEVDHDNNFPLSDTPNTKTHNLFFAVKHMLTSTTTYQDLTSSFPVQYSRGNNYLLICYSYDANAILAHPLCNRTVSEIVKGWEALNEHLHSAGVHPECYILDNECSGQFHSVLQEKRYRLPSGAPPHSPMQCC